MSNNKKNGWIVFIAFMVIQLISLFVLAKAIEKKTILLVEEKHKLKALEQKGTSLIQLQEDYQLLGEDIEIIDQALPNKEKIVDFINEMEKQASASGILAEISFGGDSITAESGGLKSACFSLNLKGTYFEIMEFVKKVEKMPQVISIDKITIQSPQGIENENNAILMMRCYIDPNF